jgi:hypothetical protein
MIDNLYKIENTQLKYINHRNCSHLVPLFGRQHFSQD